MSYGDRVRKTTLSDSDHPLYQNGLASKLSTIPDWATEVEDDPVICVNWFSNVNARWSMTKPGLIEIVCPSQARVVQLRERYFHKIDAVIRRKFAGVDRVEFAW